jgi:hypothetical protein
MTPRISNEVTHSRGSGAFLLDYDSAAGVNASVNVPEPSELTISPIVAGLFAIAWACRCLR